VRETAAELKALQELIDKSHKRIGPHMKAITDPRTYPLSAFSRHYCGSAFDRSANGVYVKLDAIRFLTSSRTPKEFPS
jgi:hypothetical protein